MENIRGVKETNVEAMTVKGEGMVREEWDLIWCQGKSG